MTHLEEGIKIFSNLHTLSTIEIGAKTIVKLFGFTLRNPELLCLQKFIQLNKYSLDFLGITPEIKVSNQCKTLLLTTSKYVGVAPLFSPATGKPVLNFTITGRYNEEVGEIIPLLGDSIQPEFSDSLHLNVISYINPPIYLDCCRFIEKYIQAYKYKWIKFKSEVKIQKQPNAGTDWNKYSISTALDPLTTNTFCNKCNILTTHHKEWDQLNYILKISIEVLSSRQVPNRVKIAYSDKINLLSKLIKDFKTETTTFIPIRSSDHAIIKELKQIGNMILSEKSNLSIAWRIDYTLFFERFVQHIFSDVAKKKNASFFCNKHYSIIGNKPQWGLSYLEPDLVIQKDVVQFVIDAKYKSHVFDWFSSSEKLKDEFRHDLHQILGYSSFSCQDHKKILLVYPYTSFIHHDMKIMNPINPTHATLHMIGIPLNKSLIEETKKQISQILDF